MKSKILFGILSMAVLFITFANAQDFASLKATGDQFWKNRDDQTSLIKAIDAYEMALKVAPEDEDLLTRIIRAYYWKGMNLPENDKKGRLATFQTGMDYGERLLKLNPKHVGGNFWYASNKAMYGNARGIMKSLAYLSSLKKHVHFVMEQEKFFFNGGPQRYLAKLSNSVPGLLRKSLTGYSLKDAERMLKEAIEYQPDFALSYLFLGEIYITKRKKGLAKEMFHKVLETPEDSLPEFAAENRRDKRDAKAYLTKYFGESFSE